MTRNQDADGPVTARELRAVAASNRDQPMSELARSLAELLEGLPESGPIRPADEPPLFDGEGGAG